MSNKSSSRLALEREEASILSPLRYPGSKRRLAGYIKQTLTLNSIHPELFVEPFAGGASVALQLLNDNMVERIGLIEIDPLVSAFWKTVFFDADWLVNQVETIDVTLEQWHQFKATVPEDTRNRALACLFLNRTSFSGLLTPPAGPIGGKQQKSEYKIDCRFPRKTLVKRIRQAAALKDRVAFVWNFRWQTGLGRIRQMQKKGSLPNKNILFYLDPPFFEKADKLYRYYFDANQHRRLRDVVVTLDDDWILSYNSPRRIDELYGGAGCGSIQVEVLYSTSSSAGSRAAQEVILTNLDYLPCETRLWRGKEEWKNKKSCSKNAATGNGKLIENSHQQLEDSDCQKGFKNQNKPKFI